MSDERDPRDPALDAAWRAHSTETPPAALDRTILAAAHRAAGSAPRSASPAATRPWRWWMPLAAAATIGAIAIGVLQTLPPEPDEARTVASDMPAAREEAAPAMPLSGPAQRPFAPRESSAGDRKAAPPAPEQSAPAAVRPAPAAAGRPRPAAPPRTLKPEAPREDAGAVRGADDTSAQRAERAPEPFPARKERAQGAVVAAPGAMGEPADVPAAVPPPPVAAAAPRPPYDPASAPTADRQHSATSLGDRAATGFGDRAATAGAAGRSVAGGSPLGKSIVGAEPAPPREPDAWIARIRALHTAGELEEAARELAAFRAAYRDADARLPASLRAWAATIRP